MLFDIIGPTGVVLSTCLDMYAPAIRLVEGEPVGPQATMFGAAKNPRPHDLEAGEATLIEYPLIGRTIVCEVRRVE